MCLGYDVLLQRETPAELEPEAHLETSSQLWKSHRAGGNAWCLVHLNGSLLAVYRSSEVIFTTKRHPFQTCGCAYTELSVHSAQPYNLCLPIHTL